MAKHRFFDGAALELGLILADPAQQILSTNFLSLNNFFYNPTWRRSYTITPKYELFNPKLSNSTIVLILETADLSSTNLYDATVSTFNEIASEIFNSPSSLNLATLTALSLIDANYYSSPNQINNSQLLNQITIEANFSDSQINLFYASFFTSDTILATYFANPTILFLSEILSSNINFSTKNLLASLGNNQYLASVNVNNLLSSLPNDKLKATELYNKFTGGNPTNKLSATLTV